MSQKVVITGMGVISGLGSGVSDYWENLKSGRSAIKNLDLNVDDLKIHTGAKIPGYVSTEYFSENQLSLLDEFSQYAILAAKEALGDAGLLANDYLLNSTAAIIGTGCGGKQTDEETYLKLYKEKKNRVHPLTIPKGMPSAAASSVSQFFNLKGAVYSITSACASAAHAIIQGSLLISSGLYKTVLVGGTDAPFTYGLLKSWEALRVVSPDTCRPFSRDRGGMVLGEGSGMLLLESEESAKERGARIYAEISGYGMSSDAGHITRPDVDGIKRAIEMALVNAGIDRSSVDYINAHGTGTVANDLVETEAIKKVFLDYSHELVVSSTKSMHGHALGASSALELIATVLSMKNKIVPPTANYLGPSEGCDLDYVPIDSKGMDVKVALSNSFAFGGLNAVIVVQEWD